ncbi:N-acetyl-1-D-myo-inositol-2-amino-2-deoxy-alpha-D-glucopyranoside deacetylase [Cellulomonas sp. PhB150]|uniref:N-acetyl-1-D-myo-inositol-2-amino-2-deoxy-alpha- D-glucopyranoside deacetylase n=1 Tax=Cellulomonas sp. PhB150 TaxID=2485188 RepID=UPI000F4A816F|nr:N-acetyl-1-D-myo-inositol-2-amino-2-deoxy-alpha-D-glucopyranoside deacetylase [Cellulomonas sp. PhB150]ROS23074.1 N-acetyl-1-D-myo-inositol-2-amino-2-deoxy-alpha-D-glucopyranoside deacetylase [Cellulomonas sp. PhB150]
MPATTEPTTPAGAVGSVVGGLLAVHAHPDDETLATGALLATWAAAGLPVTVVTCTRGERGEVIGDELAHLEGDGPALAAHRTTELAAALAALGVEDHVYLDGGGDRYEDSGMAWLSTGRAGAAEAVPPRAFVGIPLDEAAGRLAAVLRDRRPAVVVTYEPAGGYGHPDHVRAHEVTRRAIELAGIDAVVLWAAQGSSALRAGLAALEPVDGLVVPDPDEPLPSVAVPDEDLDLVVHVAPVVDRVLAALRAHATQVQAVAPLGSTAALAQYALSNAVLAPVLPDEGYRVAVPGPALDWPAGIRRR